MAPENRLALETVRGMFQLLQILATDVARNATATAALVHALSEVSPEVGQRYEKYLETDAKISPSAQKARELTERIDGVIRAIEKELGK